MNDYTAFIDEGQDFVVCPNCDNGGLLENFAFTNDVLVCSNCKAKVKVKVRLVKDELMN